MDQHTFAPQTMAPRKEQRLLKSWASAAALYGGATVLCLAMLTWVLRLWEADLTVPYNYGGDALCMLSWIKGIIDHGWYLHNDSLGAPFGQDMHDFPMADNLHFLLMKTIALAFPDAAITFNIY